MPKILSSNTYFVLFYSSDGQNSIVWRLFHQLAAGEVIVQKKLTFSYIIIIHVFQNIYNLYNNFPT